MYSKNNQRKPYKKNFRPKKTFKRPQKRIFTKEQKMKMSELDKTVKSITSQITKVEKELKNKEPSFKDENLNKEITLLIKGGGEIKGTLVNIDKYRIQVQVGDRVKYYYKHSLLGYHLTN